jgi:hypothetical protein
VRLLRNGELSEIAEDDACTGHSEDHSCHR